MTVYVALLHSIVLGPDRRLVMADLRAMAEGLGRRAGRGDGGDAQRQAGEENPKAAHAGPQLAQRKTQGERHQARPPSSRGIRPCPPKAWN